MLFKWLELALEYFESHSKGWNWHSNASNPVLVVGIGIRVLRIPFEWLELAFECFESRSNASIIAVSGGEFLVSVTHTSQ